MDKREALTPSTRLTGNSGGDTIRAVLRLTKDQVEQTLCASLESRLDDAGIAREHRFTWVNSACGTAVAEIYERWVGGQPEKLTTEQIDALPVGSVIADRDGDNLVRLGTDWRYSEASTTGTYPVRAGDIFGPYTLVSTPQKEPENA